MVKQNKTKKKLNGKIFVKRSLLCCLIGYLCFLLISQQINFSRLGAREAELDAQLEEAQKDAKELEAQKDAAGTTEYIERIAREKLGLMKPDEKVFIDSSK